jgi:hypothetical protein
VNVFELLFSRHPRALRSIAATIRQQIRYYFAQNRCANAIEAGNFASSGWRHIPLWVSLMHRNKAMALTRNGLEVGFDPGDYFHRSCGLSTFLVPHPSFEAFLGIEGQVLIDSFVYETYNPPARYALPVRACRSSYGVNNGRGPHMPRTLAVVAPPWFLGQMAIYTDTQQYEYVVAPNGWRCDAGFGADGGGGISVYPPPETRPHLSYGPSRSTREGVYVWSIPACVGCFLQQACPYFASARSSWHRDGYGNTKPDPCMPRRKERVQPLSKTVVRVVDPPGVLGNLWPSGGTDTASGDVGYFPDSPYFGPQGSYIETCTLPDGSAELCDALLGWFAASYGGPVAE